MKLTSKAPAGKLFLLVAVVFCFLVIVLGVAKLQSNENEPELKEVPGLIPTDEITITNPAPTPEEMEKILDTPQRVILGEYTVTGYCPCQKCSEGWGRTTASGATATSGHTIATDSSFPFGTKLWLEGLGTYVVEDRGGAVKGNHIDVFFDTHTEAAAFGKQTLVVCQEYA